MTGQHGERHDTTFSRRLRAIREEISARTTLRTCSITEHNPLFPLGSPGQWDEVDASWGSVLRSAPHDWRMYYSGKDRKGYLRIGIALSGDDVNWKKYDGNPMLFLVCVGQLVR